MARQRSRRRGGILFECLITAIVLGTAGVLTATLLVTVMNNRRSAERLLVANEELNNQLERLVGLPWEKLVPDQLPEVQPSALATSRLPECQLKVSIQEVTAPAQAKRLALEISWQDRGGVRRQPLRMTTWVMNQQGGT